MKLKIFIFFTFFFATFYSDVAGDEKKVTKENLEKSFLFGGPQDELEIRKEARENLDLLEEIIFHGEIRDCGPKTSAISYLSLFARENAFPRERFFNIACRYIKNVRTLSLPKEVNTHLMIISMGVTMFGYDDLRKIHRIPVIENLQAFLLFIKALDKNAMILDKSLSPNLEKTIKEVTTILESEKGIGINSAIEKMDEGLRQIQKFENKGMAEFTFPFVKYYWLNLIDQIKNSKF